MAEAYVTMIGQALELTPRMAVEVAPTPAPVPENKPTVQPVRKDVPIKATDGHVLATVRLEGAGTAVKFREMADAMGYTFSWDPATGSITIEKPLACGCCRCAHG